MKRIPFIPFSIKKARERAEFLRGLAAKLLKRMPNLNTELLQARMDISAVDYLSIAILSTIFWFGLTTIIMFAVVVMDGAFTLSDLKLMFMVSGPITLLSAFYIVVYPKVEATRRMRFLERDLLFALRHALVEVHSGVTLFNAMASIAKGGYGLVSFEFNKIVKNINVGTPETQALEKSALENPSANLRNVIWQISNALKAGSDIGSTLESLVNELEKEQLTAIRKYGHEMNPWTMMYMMMGIIMPALGITFMIVLSSFLGFSSGQSVFYLIIVFVLFFQVFFLSFMKTKRPVVGM